MTALQKVTVSVVGTPGPQGSKVRYGRRLVEQSKLVEPWRDCVVVYTRQATAGRKVSWAPDTPLRVIIIFRLQRPKSHFRANGELRSDAPEFVSVRPDLDKFVRATFDGLESSGILLDAQIAQLQTAKKYVQPGKATGADIVVEALTDRRLRLS